MNMNEGHVAQRVHKKKKNRILHQLSVSEGIRQI